MFDGHDEGSSRQRNVFGAPLATCSNDPRTGFFRDGCCHTGPQDRGLHIVCAVMTDEFLRYSRAVGNDLSTPAPQYGFAGLKPGDRWCLCGARWKQALDAGCAPQVILAATHEAMLQLVTLDALMAHAVDVS
ncbi:MAG: DUF2237 domain-containing protein [Deltaproteobacteria bacterium]|nr:DUF2237 domain-containing protein [Deltaproteobacteria bacterium]